VLTNLLIGVAIVVGVLLVTLGWRSAFIVAIIIPFASLISIFGLQLAGISIHQMSVTGLIVALGLLVDAGIVMVDDIRRRLATGVERTAAVEAGIRRLAVPLLASTVTTALAFTPMILLPGPAGDFVGAIALAVVIMLAASLVLALTVTPALAGWMLPRPKEQARPDASQERRGAFFATMQYALAHPRVTILASLILPVIGFGAFPTLTAQFFPGVDRDQFYIQVKLPEGTAIAETDRVVKRATTIIRNFDGIRQLNWVIGENAPAFYYNMVTDQDNQPSFAEALVTTVSPSRTEAIIPELQRRLDAALPSARVTVRGLVQGPPVNAPVEVRLVGEDLAVLRQLGEQVRKLMLDIPEVIQARTQLIGGPPKARVDFDEERLRLTGLTLGDAARELDVRLEGTTGGSLIERSEELPVRVRVGATDRGSVGALSAVNLTPPNANAAAAEGRYPGIPLTAVGDVKIVPAETPIYRRNGERINTVQGFVRRTVLPEEALQSVLARMQQANFTLPDGYRMELGGDSDARDETIRNLMASMGLIVALTIATIVLTFGSYRLAGVTIIVAVLSMGLSLLALAIFRYPFGIQAVIGVIGSIGVSINAAIIIMTALQNDERAVGGDRVRIAEIVVAQSRHIISTTLTTFGGFLPLILDGGGFWPPFAMSIAGGVLLSTVVSFYFTPPVFALLSSNGRLKRALRPIADSPPSAAATSAAG
ncbi:MAG: efflux RND transporter permease subunit, partial [Pseudomonadota bacterium]